jgi:hypothetical protein
VLSLLLLKTLIRDGSGNPFNIFSGFLPADKLLAISTVPAFTDDTPHAAIGRNVNSNPVEEWQRPEIGIKIEAIRRRFSEAGEIMPNPVLLAAVEPIEPSIIYTAADGTQTCEVLIDTASRKLLVLDGQHRIKGIAASTQPGNPIPFVLLADVGAPAYNRSMFAKIFAEVTTQSSNLNPLHDAWLKYAFSLDEYEPAGRPPKPTPSHLAMETASILVSWNPAAPATNPFYDKIGFNPQRELKPPTGQGFVYNADELSQLVRYGYFGNQRRTTHLSPQQVAEALAESLVALAKVCTTPIEKSVFFGSSDFGHQPMQNAFVLAVLSRLATAGVPGSWETILTNLRFNTANWNFKTWVKALDGNFGNHSRELATRCLTEAFDAGTLGEGIKDIPTHLQGDNAAVTVTFMKMGAGGRALANTAEDETFPVSRIGVHSFAHAGDYKLSLKTTTTNIHSLVAWDSASPRDEFTRAKLASRGIVVTKPPSDSREIIMRVEYYGGVEEQLKLTLNW